MEEYTIGQISKLVGLATKTIRFYEDEKVISAAQRKENGYRVYQGESVEELRLIKYAREMGLPLTEIKKLMKGCGNGKCEHSKDYVAKTVEDYIQVLETQINQLTLLKTRLKQLNTKLENDKSECDKSAYCCDIFHQLLINEIGVNQ